MMNEKALCEHVDVYECVCVVVVVVVVLRESSVREKTLIRSCSRSAQTVAVA